MPSTTAERKQKHIQKLKERGLYDMYKEKKARQERERRRRLKESLAHVSNATRMEILNEQRKQSRERVQKYRQRKKENAYLDQSSPLNECATKMSETVELGSFRSEEELNKAVARVERSLPTCPKMRMAVLSMLCHEVFSESELKFMGHNIQIKEEPI